MKNLIIASPINARITGPTEVEIDAADCVVRLTMPHADRRALNAICKTVNFAIRMKDAKCPDNRDSGNIARPEVTL